MFEQYFYNPINSSLKFGSDTILELNAGGPYRKCKGGLGATGEADCELNKRKFYSISFAGNGVTLRMPDKNRYEGMFSGAHIVRKGA